MASEKQIEANQRNAQKSTGPRTPEGKAVVSMNPLKHGLRARRAVLPDENEADFHQLCADLEAEWQPANRTEQLLLEEMVMAHWKLARMELIESQTMAKGHVNKEQMALLVQVFQQQARLRRAFEKSMRELERRQSKRTAPDTQPAKTAPAPAEPVVMPVPDAPTPVASPQEPAAPSCTLVQSGHA